MVIYLGTIFGFILLIILYVVAIRRRVILGTVLGFISTLMSLYFIWSYVDWNYIRDDCDVENGCMNETGMLMMFGIYLLILSILILIVSLVIHEWFFKKRVVQIKPGK